MARTRWFWRLAVCFVTSLSFAGARADNSAAWAGTYLYEAQAGYDGGGTAATGNPIVLDINLTIGADGSCGIEADGFQTEETVDCRILPLPGPNGIAVRFKDFAPNTLKMSGFFSTSYPADALLFSLIKMPDQKLMTVWHAIRPDVAKSDRGVFFVKNAHS